MSKTNFKAAGASLVAARLLENDDLEFYNILTPRGGNLDIWNTSPTADNVEGELHIWWSVEIDARDWGIKEITPFVKKLKMSVWMDQEDEQGVMQEGPSFHYEYPEDLPKNIGPDPDAPTPDNIVRLASPKWKVEWKVDQDRKDRTTFAPSGEIDVKRRTIEILF